MGQHPRSVVGINVTVGPWVITSGRARFAAVEGGGVIAAERNRTTVSDRDTLPGVWEPEALGLYEDRDGDIWEKAAGGWRLRLQDGVEVDPDVLWDWVDGHVRDYAPFLLLN